MFRKPRNVSETSSSLEEVQVLRHENAVLRAQLAWFQKQLFGGGKSEKLDPGQLKLDGMDAVRAAVAERTEKIAYERTKGAKPTRATAAETFAKLPVTETVEIIPEPVKKDPDLYERIGEERTFEVDVVPPQLVKREIVRPKYRHRLDRTRAPLLATAPARVVPGGYASASLIAWILISKYVDHLPLYRQEQMSARWGAQISRRTMCDWVEVAALWLEPIYRHMHQGLLRGGYIQADETPVRCNDPDHSHGTTLQCYLWVISRPGADVVFAWRKSRRHEELTPLLADFKGILQSDAYGAYASHQRTHEGVVHVGCWAHARRYFHKALDNHRRPAELVLRLIAKLYRLEAQWDEAGVTDERAALRKKHFARPLWWLRRVTEGLAKKTLPKSKLGEACTYLLNNWDILVAHQQHAVTRIDNNLVENVTPSSGLG